MKRLQVGDKEKAICNTCQALTDVTYRLRDVPFSAQSSWVVKNVLVGICDGCDSTVTIPHQETNKLKKFTKYCNI